MPNTLQIADWPKGEGAEALVTALGADNMRWVGGAVRDTLLGLPVKDIDCATTLEPDEVAERCNKAGIAIVPTGIEHGTNTAIVSLSDGTKEVFEVTTLRRDVATDGRRATVAFAKEWHEDAARRDFTINALYAHPETLEISDYFGGLDDLTARRVRFIGDARARIAEDYLRILRYYRFQARFGAELDPVAEEACAELSATLKGLSRERVADELLRLLTLPDPGETVARMFERGVLPVILPESCAPHVRALHKLIECEAEQSIAPDPIRRLAALLPPSPDVAEGIAARLRLSKAQRARLVSAAERQGTDADAPQALAYQLTVPFAVDRLLLLGHDARPLEGWEPPIFPLKGGNIVERGVAAGPQVARFLQTVEKSWIAEGFPDASRVAQILDSVLKEG
ncbi:CCA tRNA nucleotidyltransferase [uncultured Erythrobacter sp.]|uniref:CCA tRNA nucleotidyltransferase n=1 Tax=uncultured Erythrobacter sp. TaxID=263913 RepID=UPI002604CE9A|nr:CCA tRNA nucleotidyltransferase [uncultured Erythrobacter sp.]